MHGAPNNKQPQQQLISNTNTTTTDHQQQQLISNTNTTTTDHQ